MPKMLNNYQSGAAKQKSTHDIHINTIWKYAKYQISNKWLLIRI